MRLAILMTNTDESEFAHRHPKDGEKFTDMIHSVRPTWQTEVFSVKDDEFPESLWAFDGAMITGSPASVLDPDPWVDQTVQLLQDAIAREFPLFGACFGHQAIAKALGSGIIQNPEGWAFGRVSMDVVSDNDLPTQIDQYAAHIEQVESLPEGAKLALTSKACPIGGFTIGSTVMTTQNHPEMTPDFISALVDEYHAKLPSEVAERAAASLSETVDGRAYAEAIARFFEKAVQ